MSVKLDKGVKDFRIDESLLFKSLQSVAEVLDDTTFSSILLSIVHTADQAAAE